MTPGANNGLIQRPDLRATLYQLRLEIMANTNCHLLGTIQSFDTATQSATVSINARKTFGSTLLDYPPLVQVPVLVLSGGTACLTMPIAKGDTCLVCFNDRDFDSWWESGSIVPPNSDRLHSLADGLALVGFRSNANPLAGYNATKAQLKNNGGIVSVDAKLKLANASQSLKDIFDQLITALKGFVDTNGDTPSPATLAAFTAVQTAADALFE